jgi:hypothetical protein
MPDLKININGAEVVVPEQTVTEAITKGELTISNEEIKVFKKPDFETYLENVKKADYENGKVAGVEMQIKAAREKFGLSFEGKTIDNFAEALTAKNKAEFGKEPDKRVIELTNDLEALRGVNANLQNQFTMLQNEKKQSEIQAKKTNLILGAIPKENLTIPAEDLAVIFKSRYDVDFDETDGKPLIKKDGQVLKSQTTLSPLAISEIMNEFVKPYVKANNGGRGGSHEISGTPGGIEAFIKEMEERGVKAGTPDFNKEMSKRISEKTLQTK